MSNPAVTPTAKWMGEFRLNDPVIYEWHIRDTTPSFIWDVLVAGVFGTLLLPVLAFSLCFLIGMVSTAVIYWISWPILILCTLFAWDGFFTASKRPGQAVIDEDLKRFFTGLALGVWLFILAAPGHFFASQFKSLDASFWQWCAFFADNLLKVVTLDIFDIFETHLSQITPVTFAGRAATVMLRLMIAIAIVESCVRIYKLTYSGHRFYGTVQDCYDHCGSITFVTDIVVERLSILLPAPKVSAPMGEFRRHLKSMKPPGNRLPQDGAA